MRKRPHSEIDVQRTWPGGHAGRRAAVSIALLAPLMGQAAIASAEGLATDWVEGHNVRTRMIAGRNKSADLASRLGLSGTGSGVIVAGVAVDMADGWKTYWRNPGDAGGVPPSFEWGGSKNVAKATVLYPAPQRIVDKAGTNIGYKSDVVFPVLIEPKDASAPVELKLTFSFGTCREICVPGESEHALTVAADQAGMPPELAATLERVPTPAAASGTPHLRETRVVLDGDAPRVVLDAEFPAGRKGADAFVTGPDGEYVPMPMAKREVGDTGLTFEIDLTMGADIAALRDKAIVVTLVSSQGQSEQSVVLTPRAR